MRGLLIVKDKMIISDGFNGTPSGFDNNCEDENGDREGSFNFGLSYRF